MKFFEKAIENYTKKQKQFYREALRKDILFFSGLMEEMAATGRCRGIACNDCPVRLAVGTSAECPPCGVATKEKIKALVVMEFKGEE